MSDFLHAQTLFRSRLITIFDVRCRPHCASCGAEEQASGHQIVFPRRGIFVKRGSAGDAIVADPTLFLFFNRHESFRVVHPVPGGDDCTVVNFEGEALNDFLRRVDPACKVSSRSPFRIPSAASSNAMVIGMHFLRQRLQAPHAANPLDIEETSAQILGEAVAIAARQRGNSVQPVRADTRRAHHELVHAARIFLARNFRDKVTLHDIARAIFSSPFHLARVFRRETGATLHSHLSRLRLCYALNQIADGTPDLTVLALDLGFSSHAHFTQAFRRRFGKPPSEVRRHLSSKLLRELSKNLEA